MENDNIKKMLIDLLNQARSDIRANMETTKVNASGRTSASLQVEEYDNGVRLVSRGDDIAPFPTLEVGRRAGKVPKGFRHILYQWSIDKGIPFETDSERKTFAYFLAKKIAGKGTERHRSPRSDVYSYVIEKLRKEVENQTFMRIAEIIKTHIKQ